MKKYLYCFLALLTCLSADTLTQEKEKPYRILSIDGGGIRGVFSLQLLSMLEEELHFLHNVDFFAGTSTGSIIALGLALGKTPDYILQFYIQNGKSIFMTNSCFDPISFWSKYRNDGLKQAILESIPETLTLADLPKKCLAVSFELYNETRGMWAPCVFDNFDLSISQEVTFLDTILRSSAAPTYFASHQGFIDGGIVANNPSMVAIARAIDHEGGKQKLNQLRLFSVGTGFCQNYIEEDIDWGISRWMVVPFGKVTTSEHPLIDILFDAGVEMADYQCQQILGNHYFRLNASFAESVSLDDPEQIEKLIEDAKRFPSTNPHLWNQVKEWIKINFCN